MLFPTSIPLVVLWARNRTSGILKACFQHQTADLKLNRVVTSNTLVKLRNAVSFKVRRESAKYLVPSVVFPQPQRKKCNYLENY